MLTLPANKWVAVTLPLEALGIKDRTDLTNFFIQGMSQDLDCFATPAMTKRWNAGPPSPIHHAAGYRSHPHRI